MFFETIITSFSLGLLATATPCVLPLYPGFLAYISGGQAHGRKRYFLGFFVLLGVLTMMLMLGLVIALLAVSVGRALAVLIPIADLLIVVLGIVLILNKNPFKALPQIQVPVINRPFVNAFVYGLLYGPIALPCSGPLVVGIFTYSFTIGEVLGKLNVFLWFGLGFGMPLLALSLFSGALQHSITTWFARHSKGINLVAGILLVVVGVYDFIANWEMIQAYLHL